MDKIEEPWGRSLLFCFLRSSFVQPNPFYFCGISRVYDGESDAVWLGSSAWAVEDIDCTWSRILKQLALGIVNLHQYNRVQLGLTQALEYINHANMIRTLNFPFNCNQPNNQLRVSAFRCLLTSEQPRLKMKLHLLIASMPLLVCNITLLIHSDVTALLWNAC